MEEIGVDETSCTAGPSDGGEKDLKGGKDSIVGHSERDYPQYWNPFDLRFEDQELEAWFCRDRLANWIETDSFAHATSLVPAIMTLMVTWRSLSTVLRVGLAFSTLTSPLLWWWCAKPSYCRYRSGILSVSRVASAVQAAHVAISGLSATLSSGAFLGRLVIWGPLAPLVVSSANVRLPFKVHFPVQVAAMLFSTFWIQAMCVGGSRLNELFGSIGEGIDGMMVKMYLPFLHETVGTISVPCYTIVPFLHLVVGFVVPTLLVFVLETQSRAEFLMKVLGPEHHSGIHRFLRDALWFGCWAALFFTQASWAVLSLQRVES